MADLAVSWIGGSAVVDEETGRILHASDVAALDELADALRQPSVRIRDGRPAEGGGLIVEAPDRVIERGAPGFVAAVLGKLDGALVV